MKGGAPRAERPSLRERARAWWRARPLGVTFAACVAVYLLVATAACLALIGATETVEDVYRRSVTGIDEDSWLFSGPYIYDSAAHELRPATEISVPGAEGLAVFLATGEDEGAQRPTSGAAATQRAYPEQSQSYATVAGVERGAIGLMDWGLNGEYPGPGRDTSFTNYEDGAVEVVALDQDNLAQYDTQQRTLRADPVAAFKQITDIDLRDAFGADRISNVAYYAFAGGVRPPFIAVSDMVQGVGPFVIYGGLAIVMFRRFYRTNIAEPLGELAVAAERIGSQDLDFEIEPVRGRELARLGATLDAMRAELLRAQRHLWHTFESRRQLNAAFAHDLRTPITVLKGTAELARMRVDAGKQVTSEQVERLQAQVARLESYANAMSGVCKLEDRAVNRAPLALREAEDELRRHAREVVAARAPELAVEVRSVEGMDGVSATAAALLLDMSLVEEVLDNLLSNACGHARARVVVELGVGDNGDSRRLIVRVRDDGDGFSPEALHRACDAFYSENKSAEHFGLGLNVSSVLAELHGGDIELANGPCGGACVTATFECGCKAPGENLPA